MPPRQPIREYDPFDPGGHIPGHPGTPPPGAPSAPPAPPTEPLDWLGIPGLPADVLAAIDRIFRDGAPNATERALAYLRTTSWYQGTYRGIGAGIQKGIISNEADYRAYVGGVNALFRRYHNRDATADEIEAFLNAGFGVGEIGQRLEFTAGFSELFQRYHGRPPTQEEINAYYGSGGNIDVIGRRFQGEAYVAAERGDLQYYGGAFGEGRLTEEELKAYGEQKAGLESTLGTKIMSGVQKALQRYQRVFEGTLATQSLSIEGGVLSGAERRRRPDISA